jgi:hypothetical protein
MTESAAKSIHSTELAQVGRRYSPYITAGLMPAADARRVLQSLHGSKWRITSTFGLEPGRYVCEYSTGGPSYIQLSYYPS